MFKRHTVIRKVYEMQGGDTPLPIYTYTYIDMVHCRISILVTNNRVKASCPYIGTLDPLRKDPGPRSV